MLEDQQQEMKIFGFQVQGEKIELQIDLPSGGRSALQFDMELDDLDAVQDFINHFEDKVKDHFRSVIDRSWEAPGNGFKPDRRK